MNVEEPALNDVAFFPELFEEVKELDVAKTSLLRFVSATEVTGQLHRIAHGFARLTNYHFSIDINFAAGTSDTPAHEAFRPLPVRLDFQVNPESNPPSNIHVLISRNGIGKTTLLNQLVSVLAKERQDDNSWMTLRFSMPEPAPGEPGFKPVSSAGKTAPDCFANIVFVSFSVFDEKFSFDALGDTKRLEYIGVKGMDTKSNCICNKTPLQLENEFTEAILSCLGNPRRTRLKRLFSILQSDPVFSSFNTAFFLETLALQYEVLQAIVDYAANNAIFSIFNDVSRVKEFTSPSAAYADTFEAAVRNAVLDAMEKHEQLVRTSTEYYLLLDKTNSEDALSRSDFVKELLSIVKKSESTLSEKEESELHALINEMHDRDQGDAREMVVTAFSAVNRLSDGLVRKVIKQYASEFFSKLSSGHKIVLLTVARLVETVEEKTLILFDEPEAHLHPPLLSSLVRCISDLLYERNGVAIIATHSPVVLQEVPRECVWKLTMIDEQRFASRPDIETFGENVGVLTRDVFELEVEKSGFHSLLRKAVIKERDQGSVERHFDGKLGSEARALLHAFIFNKVWERDA